MTKKSPKMSITYWVIFALTWASGVLTALLAYAYAPPHTGVRLMAALITLSLHAHLLIVISEPYYFRDSSTYVQPTNDQRTELERLCEVVNFQVKGVWASTGLDRFMPAVILGGFPGNRHLIADRSFFSEYTGREREAIVIYETYLARRYYYVVSNVMVSLPLITYILVIGQARRLGMDPLGPWLFTLGAILAVVPVIWGARQLVYRALDQAVAHTDVETVKSIVERVGESEGEMRKNLQGNSLDMIFYPTTEKRLEHLR